MPDLAQKSTDQAFTTEWFGTGGRASFRHAEQLGLEQVGHTFDPGRPGGDRQDFEVLGHRGAQRVDGDGEHLGPVGQVQDLHVRTAT